MLVDKLSLRRRLANQREDRNIKQGEIGAKLGIKQATVSLYEREPERLRDLGLEFTMRFFKAYEFSESESDELARGLFQDVITHFMTSFPSRGVTDKGPKVRLLGEIGAGLSTGVASDETNMVSVPDWIAAKYNLDDVFAVDVVGHSMTCEEIAKTIPEGSRVFFHRKLAPNPGEVVACYLKHHDIGVLKTYWPEKRYTILESYNPLYRADPIIINEGNPAEIQGVYLGHDVKGPRGQ